MANTMSKYGSNTNRPLSEIVGLSTDTKPTDSIEGIKIQNGSSFRELDTGKRFLFDAENITWNEVSSGGGGGGGSTLIEKSISANGVYNASEDSADGYSKVTVDVAGGGGETFEVNILLTETPTVDKTYAEIKAAIESNKKISGVIDILGVQTTNILNGCVHDIVHNGQTQVANAIIIISDVFVPSWQSGTDSSVIYLIITPENTYSLDILSVTLQ